MPIEINQHPLIPDILLVQSKVYKDARGWFTETYRASWVDQFKEHQAPTEWVQENVSCSTKGSLRGLHYQILSPQAKWVRVLKGNVVDVAVDIRKNSPTFGQSVQVPLDETSGLSVIIPVGFAHGFLTLSKEAIFSYKCSDYYNPKGERGILWSDRDLNIDWNISDPIISHKDQVNPTLKTLTDQDLF